jgi:uracil-DNA glycosylase
LKKSPADVWEDLKNQVDFLAEAGGGFVLRQPEGEAVPGGADAGAAGPAAGWTPLAGLPPQTDAERKELEEIDRQVLACKLCVLHKFRTHAVPGEGNRSAELMFIGEGPGRDEDIQGRPFVGRAGQLLRKIIAAMTFREDEVYITNMVKCRPPENRVPHHEEIEACSPYLIRQIELIRPKVIVTLGKTPTDSFAPGREGMTSRRGRFGDYRGLPVMPTFHPSYLVRNEGNRELKRMVWEDMQKVMARLGRK